MFSEAAQLSKDRYNNLYDLETDKDWYDLCARMCVRARALSKSEEEELNFSRKVTDQV